MPPESQNIVKGNGKNRKRTGMWENGIKSEWKGKRKGKAMCGYGKEMKG